jgi:tRNA(Met) cytidine acetyltransferase
LRSITQLTDFREPLLIARQAGHRLMLVIAMTEELGITQAQQLTYLSSSCLWVDILKKDQPQPTEQPYISAAQANQYLGTSKQYVVYNAHSGFNASSLCGLSGTITAGGVLILLAPPTAQWHNNFDAQLHDYGQSATTAHSHFIQWWQQQWQQHQAVYVLHNEHLQHEKLTKWPLLTNIVQPSNLLEPTAQQQSVINQLVTAYNLQESMVFTIDAHRGRGKSACLGWLIKTVGKDANHGDIIVTAPSKRALGTMIQTAEPQTINFYALDVLLTSLPKAGMLIVDEAAAIPLSQLTKLICHYSLVVLSSTQDGYEGSGQGYRLKLPRIINTLDQKSTAMTLTHPMRWQANDPLETFIRSSFLCDVKTPDIDKKSPYDAKELLTYSQVTGQQLALNNELLKQVYAMLMLAHYQTTPQDLRILLDHPDHTIHLCHVGDQLASLAWVANEGGLDAELAQQIALGKRRIQGHLLAQILAQQAGFSTACEMLSWRIQRLVVLPSLQGKGLGSLLLKQIYGLAEASHVDYVGASFSVSTDILGFWQANHFSPAWLGMRADAATGLNSLQVMRPISTAAIQLAQNLTCHLRGYLEFGKGLWFESVDADVWQKLYSSDVLSTTEILSTDQQQKLLIQLAKGHAGFSGPLYLLYQKLHDEMDRQTIMYAAQNNTHKGLQRDVRHLAWLLLESSST